MTEPTLLPGTPVSTHSVENCYRTAFRSAGGARVYLNVHGKPKTLGEVCGKTKLGKPHIKFKDADGKPISIAIALSCLGGGGIEIHGPNESIYLNRKQLEALSNHLHAYLDHGVLDTLLSSGRGRVSTRGVGEI